MNRLRPAGRRLVAHAGGFGRTVLRAALIVAGFAFLDLAAWCWLRPVGYAAIGLSLLILEWLSGDGARPGART
jgi:hypothetical protein